MGKTTREVILDTVADAVSDLMYYGRKEDEDLPRGAIEDAIKAGLITKAEIEAAFARALAEYI